MVSSVSRNLPIPLTRLTSSFLGVESPWEVPDAGRYPPPTCRGCGPTQDGASRGACSPWLPSTVPRRYLVYYLAEPWYHHLGRTDQRMGSAAGL
ncbi:hypothetical protein VTK73DRAFT_8874 [Phialemonium thermophilum]|uniref:Uncharacterized protein n=1 Tax=Phialemonium thermophilum TaxID=223376 RepID=A0ABR3W5J7_9PEZI